GRKFSCICGSRRRHKQASCAGLVSRQAGAALQRLWLSRCCRGSASPPAEKITASQYETRQACTGDGSGNGGRPIPNPSAEEQLKLSSLVGTDVSGIERDYGIDTRRQTLTMSRSPLQRQSPERSC